MNYAVLSVYDKTGIEDLAGALISAGYTILSSGGTARTLEAAGIAVTLISEYTGFPELLGGRVKTLHPKIHAGILGRRGHPEDEAELVQAQIPPITLVAVNLYPFREGLNNNLRESELIELIDIGGVALLRAAAKNRQDITVLSSTGDYPEVIRQLTETGKVDRETRRRLAARAFQISAEYDLAIANWMGDETIFPPTLLLSGKLKQRMRYGENPQQEAAFYTSGAGHGTSLGSAEQLGGKELSYNNILDGDSALSLALEFDHTTAVIVKHTNPCGCAQGETLTQAFQRALAGDPKSVFGGIIAFNREVDLETAEEIAALFVEAIIAPGFSPEARARLNLKKNLRLLDTGPFTPRGGHTTLRSVYGGILVQEADELDWDQDRLKVAAGPEPTAELWEELRFAWRVCKHIKSNAIVLTRELMTIGVGAGQMSRIDAAELAFKKAAEAGLNPEQGVLASDAFFPFRDVVDLAAAAGIRAIIQPGGSIRDEDSIAAAGEHGITMVFTGIRHFRH